MEDASKDFEKDFLRGEDKVQPDADAKAGDSIWKHLRAATETQSRHYHNEGTCGDLNVDFVYVFGNLPASGAPKTLETPLDNEVAYAHTYWLSARNYGPGRLPENFSPRRWFTMGASTR